MSGYMLDTNIISDIIRNPFGAVACRIEHVGYPNICTSVIVAAELRYGCTKNGSVKLLSRVQDILKTLPILPLEIPVDTTYGSIRAELEAAGQLIGANDLLIAAHAYVLGLTLVTDNTREFSRIRGLDVQNWLER
ncbi:PIN domain-containing protein [Xylella fastidiosa subsp. sandyi]|uniref:type II toxin-antitoxin system VapC family toxin n=2 Tax=Xylella fastidiosa TaxID=2371 RepID=UPI0007076094|nr:type II toxin-antitoxin system VapC family toxin [Xylella fastidiosa]KQH72798.1 transcriptional regulator [Xylella fastidiosa]RWA43426.1 PIN domain-containing protein [Xylella fastidiosa subsp. sandyi]WNY18114.1 type II toxin-antitoxin system VapC family toxin [Xylella fastidiosa]WNY20401.1 type II toxin-antitoxin system VapC family toxin [Xylella fastidiosa]